MTTSVMPDARQSGPSFHAPCRRLVLSAFAACFLFASVNDAPAKSASKVVVTDTLIHQGTGTPTAGAVTFGQVFRQGDVTDAGHLQAILDGQPVALQVDAKASYPDGSLRHAVLTAAVPALGADSEQPLTLRIGERANADNATVTLAQLLDTPYDASVAVEINGTTYTAHVRERLESLRDSGECAPWNRHCNLWLSGPLVSEWVVDAPFETADGKTHPNLHAWFAVRAYADSSGQATGPVRTDIIIENTHAFTVQAQPRYTATLASGSATYQSPELTQYPYTRWHRVLWWNDTAPALYLRQNTGYIQDTRAVSRYMDLTPDAAFLQDLRQQCAPLDHCDQTRHMGNAGSQPAIGPLPRWTSVYMLDPDPRAYHWMLANTDALGTYSLHYRDEATGWPVSITRHPRVTIANWASANRHAHGSGAEAAAYKADLLPNCVNNDVVSGCTDAWYGTRNPAAWDNAHQPAQAFVPYMVTGDYYYMSEVAFDASMNQLWSNEGYRDFKRGLIDRGHSQIRGKAWVLREMADAAWLLPDRHPLKQEFTDSVVNSLADWNRKYTDAATASPLHVLDEGAIYRVGGDKRNAVAPWQHNFLTWSVGHAAALGFDGAARFHDWLSVFEVALMSDWKTDPTHGYCWLQASAYNVQVKADDDTWLPDFRAAYAATFPSLAGLACNHDAMVAAIGKLEGKPWKISEMVGHPTSATGFPSNFQIGIAAAAESSVAGARDAWELFQSRSVKPNDYNNYPNFAIRPRDVTP